MIVHFYDFALKSLKTFTALVFSLYEVLIEDMDRGRATAHQLFSFAIKLVSIHVHANSFQVTILSICKLSRFQSLPVYCLQISCFIVSRFPECGVFRSPECSYVQQSTFSLSLYDWVPVEQPPPQFNCRPASGGVKCV